MAFLSCDVDGTDITQWCQSIAWKPRLNLLDSAVVRFPSFKHTAVEGEELHLYLDDDLVFSGPSWFIQAEGDPDARYTEITAWDHRVYFGKLLCKWDDGGDDFNLITPCPVIEDNVTAPQILRQFIQNAIDDPARADYDPSGAAGPYGPAADIPITLGTVDAGGENVDSCPMDFPMSIQRMASLLVGTGQLDQILHPGIGSSELDLLNHYDNDLSGSVSFGYGTGAFNAQVATRTVDLEDMVNALWFLLGPRGFRNLPFPKKDIPKNHWGGSITPTAPNAQGDLWPTELTDLIAAGRALYGYMQEIQIHDDNEDEQTIRPVFEEWWEAEAEVRAVPREFLSVRPQRGYVPTFGVGAKIGVAAELNGSTSGAQVVYGFDLVQDTDVIGIEEIITSADQSLTG